MILCMKILTHFLLLTSNLFVLLFAWLFYCKKNNYLIVFLSTLATVSLVNFLKTVVQKYLTFKFGLFAWMFPAYELIVPMVFFGMLLRTKKYKYLLITMGLLAMFLWLQGYQTLESILYNVVLSLVLVIFFKALEKTFLKNHCYLVFMGIAICIIPFNMGYYTVNGILYFWMIAASYPLSCLTQWVNMNYFSSLRSKIS